LDDRTHTPKDNGTQTRLKMMVKMMKDDERWRKMVEKVEVSEVSE
jgi:hypothetical protein